MRTRRNSGVKLDYYQKVVQHCILQHQNPVTGLLPASADHQHAWVRDNVYGIMAVWGLALSYKKIGDLDEDRVKAYELEQSVIKLMRGLLMSMMMQADKVERFKVTQSPADALHAKYCAVTGGVVAADNEWGHLQIDATSLYLLTLGQMTASGLQIVFTLDEVCFVQNLLFYIQTAYRTPDYGIWERGDKTNHGLPELNASSIGMAKAALESLNELDLFGARGGPLSVVHVLQDEAFRCETIMNSLLPRESNSKETDAGLLTIVGFPGFAVANSPKADATRSAILDKLQGKYGCIRFLRDGFLSPREDVNRLHYEPSELEAFERIECQWPMFFCFLVLDGIFAGNREQADRYSSALERVMVGQEFKVIPECYAVPADKIQLELELPGSQMRVPAGKMSQMWGQSLYILGRLLSEGFLTPSEIDPLNRRIVRECRGEVVVQVTFLAENEAIRKALLSACEIDVEVIDQVEKFEVHPASTLCNVVSSLGSCSRLGLSGRPPTGRMGIMSTSKVYNLKNRRLVFLPQSFEQTESYLPLDASLMLSMFCADVIFLAQNWKVLGLPLVVFPVSAAYLRGNAGIDGMLMSTLRRIKSGYISGARVRLGKLLEFAHTSCVTNLDFLSAKDDEGKSLLPDKSSLSATKLPRVRKLSSGSASPAVERCRSVVSGIVRRTRSIKVDQSTFQEFHQRLAVLSPSGGRHIEQDEDLDDRMRLLRSPLEQAKVKAVKSEDLGAVQVDELIEQLENTSSIQEQADITHYLYLQRGLKGKVELKSGDCSVKDLLLEVHKTAGAVHQWAVVRHTAGLLKMKIDDLSTSATEILVHQKQLSVGLPPEPREKIITRPMPPDQLMSLIEESCGEDCSTAMLTQEILVYLASFIRTEFGLFREMMRLRVGLIIQVMVSELALSLSATFDDASDHLLGLSPHELKVLLHHILSNNELGLYCVKTLSQSSLCNSDGSRGNSPSAEASKESGGYFEFPDDRKAVMESDLNGQWLRRRRLDGSLNRVPPDFYRDLWSVLSKCSSVRIKDVNICGSITKEMTPGELKFALAIESALNLIAIPERRQLIVEALIVLVGVLKLSPTSFVEKSIDVEDIVLSAEQLYRHDQEIPAALDVQICPDFYDTAPSGRYGTMTYMLRVLISRSAILESEEQWTDCSLS